MFTIYTKGRYVNQLFNTDTHEVGLFEDPEGSKITFQIKKDCLDYEIIKSGDWVMAKFNPQARSKITRSGSIFFETKIYLEKARLLFPDELEEVKKIVEEYKKKAKNLDELNKKKSLVSLIGSPIKELIDKKVSENIEG